MHLTGPAVTLSTLSETLSGFTDKPIVDQTGLQGEYDIDLTFFSALTLEKPRAKGGLEGRFLRPFAERVFWRTRSRKRLRVALTRKARR